MEEHLIQNRYFLLKGNMPRCVAALNRAGLLTLLPRSKSMGVIGIDGKGVSHTNSRRGFLGLFAHQESL